MSDKIQRRKYGHVLKETIIACAKRTTPLEAAKKYGVPRGTVSGWLAKEGKVDPTPVQVKEPEEELNVDLDLAVARIYTAKHRNTNKPFQMSFNHLRGLIQHGICHYTGVALNGDNTTIERVNPFEGYTNANTVLVTNIANQEKAKLDTFLHSPHITLKSKLEIMRKMTVVLEEAIANGADKEIEAEYEGRTVIKEVMVDISSDASISDVDRSRILHGVTQLMSNSHLDPFNDIVTAYIHGIARRLKDVDNILVRQYINLHRDTIVRGMFK